VAAEVDLAVVDPAAASLAGNFNNLSRTNRGQSGGGSSSNPRQTRSVVIGFSMWEPKFMKPEAAVS
jgi:hypothetical protein